MRTNEDLHRSARRCGRSSVRLSTSRSGGNSSKRWLPKPYVTPQIHVPALRASVRQFRSRRRALLPGAAPILGESFRRPWGPASCVQTVAAIDDPKISSKAQPLQNPRLAPRLVGEHRIGIRKERPGSHARPDTHGIVEFVYGIIVEKEFETPAAFFFGGAFAQRARDQFGAPARCSRKFGRAGAARGPFPQTALTARASRAWNQSACVQIKISARTSEKQDIVLPWNLSGPP